MDPVSLDRDLAGHASRRQLCRTAAHRRPQAEAVFLHHANQRNRRLTYLRRQSRQVFDDRVRCGVQPIVLLKGLTSRGFVFDQKSVHACRSILGEQGGAGYPTLGVARLTALAPRSIRLPGRAHSSSHPSQPSSSHPASSSTPSYSVPRSPPAARSCPWSGPRSDPT